VLMPVTLGVVVVFRHLRIVPAWMGAPTSERAATPTAYLMTCSTIRARSASQRLAGFEVGGHGKSFPRLVQLHDRA
jgi:hypothetical protein